MRKIIFLLFFCFLSGACKLSLEDLSALYKQKTSQYEKLLEKNPQDIDLRLKLADFYYQFKDYSKAKDLAAGIETKRAKVILAKVYARIKDYTHAIEIFEQLGRIDDAEYLYLYAQTLEEKKLFPQAIEIYEKLKPPYEEFGRQKVKDIGMKIEEGMPEGIKQLLDEQANFLSGIQDEEAAVLFVDETIEVNEDNTSVSTLYTAQKVLKEKGRDLGEVEIGYDSTYERVELEYARTITPGNKIVYAGIKDIRDVSKYLNFPLYSNAKAFIVSMPAVEIGAILEYKVKVYSSKLINEDKFTFLYHLREQYPIGKAKFKLIVPKDKNLKYKFLNEEYASGVNLSPAVTEDTGKKVYYWEFKEIKPIIPEEEMPPFSMVNPAVIISSFDSWEEIYSWWHGLFKDKTALSEEVKAFVKDLIKDCKTDLEKAKKIYEFCAQEVRYVGVEYGESGYEPHSAVEIFWNRYGDCKDKATLLVSMLREAGLKAYPVLIPTREVYPVSRDFPSVNFNHAIAALSYNNELIFMDATASTTSFSDLPLDDQERDVFVVLDDGYKIYTTPLIEDNEIVYEMNIDINEKEDAKIERKVFTKGFYASSQRFYLKYTHPQKIKENLQERMMRISPLSKLIDYKIENVDDFDKPPVLTYSFETKKFFNPAKNLRIMPVLDDLDIDVSYIGKEERNFPIEFHGIYRIISKVKINLPQGIKVKYLPDEKEFTAQWFDFKSKYEEKENSLDFYEEFVIKKRLVDVKDYKEFKKQLEETVYFLRETIILER